MKNKITMLMVFHLHTLPFELDINGIILHKSFGSQLLPFSIAGISFTCTAECSGVCSSALLQFVAIGIHSLMHRPSLQFWLWSCFQFSIITNIGMNICGTVVGYMHLF